jgi:hypothetical protein
MSFAASKKNYWQREGRVEKKKHGSLCQKKTYLMLSFRNYYIATSIKTKPGGVV